ncbi:hypothetical protein JHK84_056800 [Glycine max]|uniref:DNA helicase n=1 Tax=Glycine max TaxID=3847 RepID=A0A0R0EQM1_SOYBN|nr:hypothetical protein JHK86_056758 [Glycine max]KAG4910913.1 hypothetical protein JHK87_057029 [Glycine soja]KAG4919492.1 hypothetical protein JHK85_057773 [Glycine max]KAG5075569.1 hypothetical protein JHK84_056800 [Glycine max]
MVWGKVKSHPWWPGQIFDPSDSSVEAKKHLKKDRHLVAYFGDRTFAWNESSQLKLFRTHFSNVVKQSNSDAFQNAVDCALDEVGRCAEFGLACSCIPKDTYDEIKLQTVQNTGIREELSFTRRVDESLNASSFSPENILEYLKTLSEFPTGGFDRLELLIAKAQLLAFYRLKGYSCLPELQYCGVVDNDTDAFLIKDLIKGSDKSLSEVNKHATHASKKGQTGAGNLKTANGSCLKRKHNLKDDLYPEKKKIILSEAAGGTPDSSLGNYQPGDATDNLISPASSKKRKTIDHCAGVSGMKDRRKTISLAKVSNTINQSFKIGERILRVANQLTGPPSSMLKCSGDRTQMEDGSADGFPGNGSDVFSPNPEKTQKSSFTVPTEYSSLDDLLHLLQWVAHEPLGDYSSLNVIVSFFSDFRNSIIVANDSGKENFPTKKVGAKRNKRPVGGSPETFEFDDLSHTHWTDMGIQSGSEKQQSQRSSRRDYQHAPAEPEKPFIVYTRRSYSRKQCSDSNHVAVPEKHSGCADENSPVELVLNFAELDSVPSEMRLNKIFRRFGPLNESETEVDRGSSRARVVFKKCVDAEVAFSSAKKFNIFGSVLVNYKLNHTPTLRILMHFSTRLLHSIQQSSRISVFFSASKPLLPRKRPSDSSPLHPHRIKSAGDVASVSVAKRVPLAEVPLNRLNAIGSVHGPSPDAIHSSFSARTVSVPAVGSADENLCRSLFETPRREPEGSKPKQLDCFSTTGLLDDDFDDSFLEQIDILCEQKSAEQQADRSSDEKLSSKSNVVGDVNLSSESGTVSEGIGNGHLLSSGIELDSREEEVDSSWRDLLNSTMPEEYLKYLKSLNDRQREAACTDISTPLMIVAGPGSGKTSTMVGRVLMLLNEGISPSNILAMTFTTAAASEMRERIGAIAGKATAKELTISTFHSFSLQLCRSHGEKLGRTSEFLIYGQGQQRNAIIEAIRLLEIGKSENKDGALLIGELSNSLNNPKQFKDKAKKWQKFVAQAKASGRTSAEYRKMGNEIGAAILKNYNNILKSCNALDYHDLISCSVKLLSDFPEVFKECQDSWKAIVIDEFQDTSAMQYKFLKMLASHHKITIVGDDDQSIYSFNGADISGFISFRNDFPNYKEIRLNKNYRSTRCIVEAASSLIQNNSKRCQLKNVLTDNSSGSKIVMKECHNEDAQCAFVVDKIIEISSNYSAANCCYGNIAILYRRQISGKAFQMAFRDRKIPFNIHGVAFYRKKVVRTIMAMLRTALPGCDDGSYSRVFKALMPLEKDKKKRIIDHINKISTIRRCSFLSAASDIFSAKISGTFKRSELTHGRKILMTLEMISKLIQREKSISAIISSVANMIPEKYLLEQRAVVDVDGGTLLNEDYDIRSVLQYLLDDVSEFLSTKLVEVKEEREISEDKGCIFVLKAFIDYLLEREKENFGARRKDNENSVTLTTIHQAKGLEWDVVFIVKANDSEIPLLHDFKGTVKDTAALLEEERRLLYVAMTRAREKLFILHVMMDSNWQMLQPSRFLKEIPRHLTEVQGEISFQELLIKQEALQKETAHCTTDLLIKEKQSEADVIPMPHEILDNHSSETSNELAQFAEANNRNDFLRRFSVENRSIVSHLFHQWAKKKAFQDPKRLLDKVSFVIDERLRQKRNKNKDLLNTLKSCLSCDEAFQYAQYVLRWEQIPADKRAHLMREKQEHFLKLKIENAMGSATPTDKQISYLKKLGCTAIPTSRLHASHLIEQFKSL